MVAAGLGLPPTRARRRGRRRHRRLLPARRSGRRARLAFLSGGQPSKLASARLNAMNVRFRGRMPWALAFSFARAIQQPALEIWRGQPANVGAAQQALFHRADCNRAARRGEYDAAPTRRAPPERIEGPRHVRHARPAMHRHAALPVGRHGAEGRTAAIPGLPLGAAPMAYVLWTRFLKHNPAHPLWPDRDRFVLSAGHGSALLYSLLHVTGYDLSLDDIKQLPPVGQQDAGPSGARPHRRRRGHDRAARPGLRQRRRHGDRRGAPGGALQPRRPRASSITAPGRSSATAT